MCQIIAMKSALTAFSMPETLINRRIVCLGAPMDALTMQETMGLIEQAMQQRQMLQHVVVNVAKLVSMQQDEALYHDVAGSDVINIDGMGVVWGARLLGHQVPERVAGVDIMENTLKLCAEKGYRPFILGAKPDILKLAMDNIAARYPSLNFAGAQDGYYDRANEQAVMEAIRDAQPDCLFIAMPSPHKERILGQYKDMMQIPFLMGVGGSVDVMAGFVKRAPKWMQNAGLEWLYRLLQEPRRMFKRYALTNSRFAWLLLKVKLGLYKVPSYAKAD